jgi:hypothetical protein
MSNLEPNTQLPPPSPDSLPIIGVPIPNTGEQNNEERFLGASNAHMSPLRFAQMKANVEAGYNPSGFGRLPGVEAPELVQEPTVELEADVADSANQTEQIDDGLIRGIPENLKVAPEDKWTPPARSSDITPK